MFQVFFVFAALFGISFARNITFDDCGHKEVYFVSLDPCDTDPCNMTVDQNYQTSYRFKANENSDTARLTGTATYPDYVYQIPEVDLCAVRSDLCPLKEGNDYTVIYNFYLPTMVPRATGIKVHLTTVGDNESKLTCVNIVVNIM